MAYRDTLTTERRYMAMAILDSRGRVVRWVDGWV